MVEGPGCRVKGEKTRGKVKGQQVEAVSGSVLEKKTKKTYKSADQGPPQSAFHELIGKTCVDVQTLGKEFFMFFSDTSQCLRVHFLMDGGIRFNGEMENKAQSTTHALTLWFNNDALSFTSKCSVDMRNAVEAQEKIALMAHLDICSPLFSHGRAVNLFMEHLGCLVCDVLLNQDVLPGVGNIIKNEALFDSGIKPSSKVEELTEAHVSHLIKMTRDFSMIFYKCRRDGKNLEPYLKVYRKMKCKQCGGKVVNTRMGNDTERLTSFCETCQTNDLNQSKRTLPSKNSLLGWVTTPASSSNSVDQQNWSCTLCTLINKYSRTNCSACLAPRHVAKHDQAQPGSISVAFREAEAIKVRRLSLPDQRTLSTFSATQKGQPKVSSVSGSNLQTVQIFQERKMDDNGRKKNSQVTSQRHSFSGINDGNITMMSHFGNSNINTRASESKKLPCSHDVKTEQVVPPSCKQHKKPSIMREVRKAGINKGRMFFSCYGRGCNFFLWADENFPLCEDHGKRCAIRTVMKQGNNNGRRFFACSQPKNKQCQFFMWADKYRDIVIR